MYWQIESCENFRFRISIRTPDILADVFVVFLRVLNRNLLKYPFKFVTL
jgi:hypothetical protein